MGSGPGSVNQAIVSESKALILLEKRPSQLSSSTLSPTRGAVAWVNPEPGISQVRALSRRLSDLIRGWRLGTNSSQIFSWLAALPRGWPVLFLPSYPSDHLKVLILGVAFKRRPLTISSLLFLDISPPTIAIYASWRMRAAARCAHNLASQSTRPSPGYALIKLCCLSISAISSSPKRCCLCPPCPKVPTYDTSHARPRDRAVTNDRDDFENLIHQPSWAATQALA